MKSTFHDRARALGHSIEALESGAEITSTIKVDDIDCLRTLLLDGAPPDVREERAEAIFTRLGPLPDPASDGSETGILARVTAFIYGDADLDAMDRERTKHLFPMYVTAISALNKTINSPWDLGESLNVMIVNLGTLTMEAGSSIFIKNTPLQFTVDNVIRNGAPPPNVNYDIAILGVTGIAGTAGTGGGTGGVGGAGSNGTCSSPGIAGSAGGKGSDTSVSK